MSTTLQAVGSQVWRGALLMADYLLYQRNDRFHGSVVLELGAGTGLVSIIAGFKASHVFCTGQFARDGYDLKEVVRVATRFTGIHRYWKKTVGIVSKKY